MKSSILKVSFKFFLLLHIPTLLFGVAEVMIINNSNQFLSSSYEGDTVLSSLHRLFHLSFTLNQLHSTISIYFTEMKTMTWSD